MGHDLIHKVTCSLFGHRIQKEALSGKLPPGDGMIQWLDQFTAIHNMSEIFCQ
jgi:hypothetical protein